MCLVTHCKGRIVHQNPNPNPSPKPNPNPNPFVVKVVLYTRSNEQTQRLIFVHVVDDSNEIETVQRRYNNNNNNDNNNNTYK